ncbi:MAG: hypothetical protein EZS28_023014, partial [Streblomastix strix]
HPVESLMDHGQLIGICGDGANDCGALKTAHVGISLSEVEASIATPFTIKEATVEAVEEVLLKGRAALVSSFHAFKTTTVFSMIRFISAQLLIYYDSIFQNFKWSYNENNIWITDIISCATVILENFYEDFVPLDMDNEDNDSHIQSFEMITIFLASLISNNLARIVIRLHQKYLEVYGLNDFLMIIPTRSPSFFIFIALSIVVMTLLLLGLEYLE